LAERPNDHVLVALLSGDNVSLPLESRAALLQEIRHLESAQTIVAAFEAVGTSRPVALTPEQRGLLVELVDSWGNQTPGGLEALPEGVFDLRNALHDDLSSEIRHAVEQNFRR
jgi:hypothetical protein